MTMLGCSRVRGGEEVNPSSRGPNCPTNRKLAGGHLTPAGLLLSSAGISLTPDPKGLPLSFLVGFPHPIPTHPATSP